MSPTLSKWLFRLATTLAPAVLDVVYELRKQLDGGGGFDWNVLASSALGVVVVALLHLSRAGTEQAESNAEVRTGVDQDADNRVEQPEGERGQSVVEVALAILVVIVILIVLGYITVPR